MDTRRIVLLAHNVRSLWNVGAFFRTADAFGVEKIYLTGYTGTPPRQEITKTAIGAEEWMPWEHHEDPVAVVETLKGEGWAIVALEQTKDSMDVGKFKPSQKVCLIAGHELDGVPEAVLDRCDHVVHIPMQGKKESLNVAVAVGVALSAIRDAGES